MKTASWSTYRGPGRIGISQGTPRGQPAGFRLYKALAPERAWMHEPLESYRPKFEAKLAGLDAKAEWDKLHEMAGGAEPVLLCFERPPFTEVNFCHRRMVASWFEQQLGVQVPELVAP